MFEFTPKLLISLWLICTFVAILGCLYALIAAGLLRHFAQKCTTPKFCTRAVSVLKPLYDTEPELEANLTSFCQQEYGGEIQLIFGLREASDPAALVVERLKKRFPERDIVLLVDPKLHGANRKVSNLINMLPHASHDVLVLSDSDIRVEATYLENVIAALDEPGVGIVSCLYRGVPVAGLWSRLAAEGINSHFLPNALVGLKLGLAKPCFGATMALSRETLARIGGFEAFANRLADDYAMGTAVRRLGLRVAIPPFLVSHTCYDRTLADLFSHELRAARTIRSIDPLGYLGLVVTNPTPFALAAAIFAGFNLPSLIVLLLTLASRMIVSIQAERLRDGGYEGGAIWLSPFRDLLSFATFVASFLPGTVKWRGHRYELRSDGTLTPS
ncbi:MAG: bacteriohopanetetrol glucosamine biosynthesis glycosyltransferase HpnI [Actinomycetota bacterium]